ncbi:hypothetical protein A3L23_05029 (plasmid) [Rhodococcoides fascians D188]|nr:hypothetical protein A3L23_05029 [Rhodococcus fascians D188]
MWVGPSGSRTTITSIRSAGANLLVTMSHRPDARACRTPLPPDYSSSQSGGGATQPLSVAVPCERAWHPLRRYAVEAATRSRLLQHTPRRKRRTPSLHDADLRRWRHRRSGAAVQPKPSRQMQRRQPTPPQHRALRLPRNIATNPNCSQVHDSYRRSGRGLSYSTHLCTSRKSDGQSAHLVKTPTTTEVVVAAASWNHPPSRYARTLPTGPGVR